MDYHVDGDNFVCFLFLANGTDVVFVPLINRSSMQMRTGQRYNYPTLYCGEVDVPLPGDIISSVGKGTISRYCYPRGA